MDGIAFVLVFGFGFAAGYAMREHLVRRRRRRFVA